MAPTGKKKRNYSELANIRHYGREIATQTEISKFSSTASQTTVFFNKNASLKDASTQTIDWHSSHKSSIDKLDFSHVSDLIDILVDSLDDWNGINHRILSVIVYILLRQRNTKFELTRDILKTLNLLGTPEFDKISHFSFMNHSLKSYVLRY